MTPGAGDLDEWIDRIYRDGTLEDEGGGLQSIFPEALDRRAGEALRDAVVETGATDTIEVGLAYGLSTLFMLRGSLRNAGTKPEGDARPSHVAIDPFQQMRFKNVAVESFRRSGVDGLVTCRYEASDVVLPSLKQEGRSFDLAFIDGDHHFDNAFVDCFYCMQLVVPGGYVVVDDADIPPVGWAVSYFVENRMLDWSHQGGRMAFLRRPVEERPRAWDAFVPFGAGKPGPLTRLIRRWTKR